jgi:hypothetical protein
MGQQRQGARLVGHVVDDDLVQAGLDGYPRPGRRPLDDQPQLGLPIGPTSAWLSCSTSARAG